MSLVTLTNIAAHVKPATLFARLGRVALCASLLLTRPAAAQTGVDIGLCGMIQVSSLSNSADNSGGGTLSPGFTTSLAGGITLGHNFTRHSGLEIDFLYSKQGATYKGAVDSVLHPVPNTPGYIRDIYIQSILNNKTFSGDYNAKVELNIIKIPILYRFSTDNTRKQFFSLMIGPQFDLLNGVNYQINGDDIALPGTQKGPIGFYNGLTVDAVLALGVGFNLSPSFLLTAHVRVDYGLMDIEEKDKWINVDGATSKYYGDGRSATYNETMGLRIGIAYKFAPRRENISKPGAWQVQPPQQQ